MINSISIGNLFWAEITSKRLSFSYPTLPQSVHLTSSLHPNADHHNIHVSKNVKNPRNKPQIRIATLEKDVLPAMLTAVPSLLLNRLCERVSFKRYSRRDRKNIRVLFYDTLEQSAVCALFQERIKATFMQHATIERTKLKLNPAFFTALADIVTSQEIRAWFLQQLKHVHNRSFDSSQFRMGMVFLGSRSYPFFSRAGQCFILRKRGSLEDVLGYFMHGDLALGLVDEGKRAIAHIKDLSTYEESRPFNRPFHLFIEGWR